MKNPDSTRGWRSGFIGVLAFACTLPATRLAVAHLDPVVIGLGRALVAALLAAVYLLWQKAPWPHRRYWSGLAWVAGGVVLVFPLLTAWAMTRVPAAHGALVIALLPLATAGVAVWRAQERLPRPFWITSLLGTVAVFGYLALTQTHGLAWADLALLLAVAAGAMGYAEGGRLARELGGERVIAWALVLAAPLLAGPVFLSVQRHGLQAPVQAWICFFFVALISQFLGFFAWYRGLAEGGIARVSQVQLIQPIFTLALSGLMLGERLTPGLIGLGAFVMALVFFGRNLAASKTTVIKTAPQPTLNASSSIGNATIFSLRGKV